MSGTSLIDAEFKADINAYLSRVPGGPVRTLADAIDGGLLHAVIEPSSRTRNAVVPDTDAIQRVTVKREAVRRIVTVAFDEHRLDAMAYPTMRRKPARIGEAQPGSTCSLSAVSGLPALSVPSGVTNDGLPIGLELLGRAFDEAKLLALAYSYEQASHARKAPFSAPPLVNGRAPGSHDFAVNFPVTGEGNGATVRTGFRFDPTTGELKFWTNSTGIPAERMLGAWIHRGGAGGS
jgi:amidase